MFNIWIFFVLSTIWNASRRLISINISSTGNRLFRNIKSLFMSFLNPFSAKCGQGQNATKIPTFRFVKFWKQIAPFESTGRDVSFEWSHHRILPTDSKVTTTLKDSNIQSGSERVKLPPCLTFKIIVSFSSSVTEFLTQEMNNLGSLG